MNIAKAEERLLARLIASNLNEIIYNNYRQYEEKDIQFAKNLIKELRQFGGLE